MSLRRSICRQAAVLLCMLAGHVSSARAQAQAQGGCAVDSLYSALDFWVGSWDVYVGDTLVGENRISKVLQGCAVIEEWQDARGGRGQSLFYVEPALRRWKQVWVTEAATRPGGTKEKHLIARSPGSAVRFQGEVRWSDSRVVLDRTTLTPLPGGEVRQLIETSDDGGTTWYSAFDARYRPSR